MPELSVQVGNINITHEPSRDEVLTLIRAVLSTFQGGRIVGVGGFDFVASSATGTYSFAREYARANTPQAFIDNFTSKFPKGFFPGIPIGPSLSPMFTNNPAVNTPPDMIAEAMGEYGNLIGPLFLDVLWLLALRGYLRPGRRFTRPDFNDFNVKVEGYSITAKGYMAFAGDTSAIVDSIASELTQP